MFKQNHYSLKDKVSDTKFCLTLKPGVKGAANSSRFDGNGVLLKNTKIIKESHVSSYHGDIRFGHYLGVKKITGNIPVVSIECETEEYRKGQYLVIENFSSPQLDSSSGYFGGEVRLARYFDGKKFIPVSGFSISGNIYEELKTIGFSKENVTDPNYTGPKYLIFKGMSVH